MSRGLLPFVAPAPARWRERYNSICDSCFSASAACTHFPEVPLRLIVLGHNPSTTAWSTGFSYAHGSNRMWSLLGESGIVPNDWDCTDSNRIAGDIGVGITDLGTVPGNDAGSYSRSQLLKWRDDLFVRLQGHAARAGASPRIIAFSGKSQWCNLFEPPLKGCDFGVQPQSQRPPGWPLPPSTLVFVLTSSSGRAAMTNAERLAPYVALSKLLQDIPWRGENVLPLFGSAAGSSGGSGGAGAAAAAMASPTSASPASAAAPTSTSNKRPTTSPSSQGPGGKRMRRT